MVCVGRRIAEMNEHNVAPNSSASSVTSRYWWCVALQCTIARAQYALTDAYMRARQQRDGAVTIFTLRIGGHYQYYHTYNKTHSILCWCSCSPVPLTWAVISAHFQTNCYWICTMPSYVLYDCMSVFNVYQNDSLNESMRRVYEAYDAHSGWRLKVN